MTLLRPQTGKIPKPSSTAVTKPFWDGCLLGELRFQRCGSCGAAIHTPSSICWNCWSVSLSWNVSSGSGELYSWTVVKRAVFGEFEVPYAPVIVDMEEGWQILSNLVGCEEGSIRIGMSLKVVFLPIEDGFTLPCFEPT